MKAEAFNSYKDLKRAWSEGKVSDDEYMKYFPSITGKKFVGYHDFSLSFFRENAVRNGNRESKKEKRSFAVVKSSCNENGDIISVRHVSLFKSVADARAAVSSFSAEVGEDKEFTWLSSNEAMLKDDDSGNAGFSKLSIVEVVKW